MIRKHILSWGMAELARTWADVGFSELQRSLDEQGREISLRQEGSANSRRELASQTREFRHLPEDQKLHEIKGLLKNYQHEIESLTARCKYAESCFMGVYESLAELPDPTPLLQNTAANESNSGPSRRESELEAQVTELKQDLQLLKVSGDTDTSKARLQSAEVESLSRELEKATLRAKQVEQRRVKDDSGDATNDLNHQISRLENENAELVARLARSQASATETATAAKEQLETATNERQILQSKLSESLGKLARQNDYEDLRKELVVLRNLEFGEMDSGSGSDLEKILERKSKHQADELASLRHSVGSLKEENESLRSSVATLEAEAKKQQDLVSKLEEDLMNVGSNSRRAADDTFSMISGWTAVPRPTSGTMAATREQPDTMVSVLTQQRDRFKKSAIELEETVRRLRLELEVAVKDKTELSERCRNLQAAGLDPVKLQSARARTAYDEGISAFQTFKSLETERMVVGMNRVDAAIFQVFCRAIVDRKFRYGACVYVGILHLLLGLYIF